MSDAEAPKRRGRPAKANAVAASPKKEATKRARDPTPKKALPVKQSNSGSTPAKRGRGRPPKRASKKGTGGRGAKGAKKSSKKVDKGSASDDKESEEES